MTVRVLSRGDSVTLQLNGITVETRSMTDADKYIAVFNVPFTAGTLVAIASKNGIEIARKSLVTAGVPVAIRLSSDMSALTTNRNDLAHILVEVLDSQGRAVPDAVVKINVSISGAGTLAGIANGNPHNPDSFTRGDRWTWHGKALAVVRPTNSAGTIEVTAMGSGLVSTSIRLTVSDDS